MAEKEVHLNVDENNLNLTAVPSQEDYSDKDSLLLHSVYQGAVPCVKYLLEDGASINMRDDDGLTPLHLSILKGHLEVFNLLIANGASLKAISRGDILPAYTAAEYDRLEMLSEILERYPEQVKSLDGFKSTLLHISAAKGSVGCVKLLLELDCGINILNIFGETALYCAVQRPQQEMVELLLENGADPNVANLQGFCPIHVAAVIGNGRIVEMLIDRGADIESVSNDSITPLFLATHAGKTKVVELLKRRNATKDCKCPSQNCTHTKTSRNRNKKKKNLKKIFQLIESNNLKQMKEFIKSGTNLEIKDHLGRTPLIVACSAQNLDAAILLIEAGANIEAAGNFLNRAVRYAAASNKFEIIKKLKEKGAFNTDDLNTADCWGFTPLATSIIMKSNVDSIKTLIEFGADINKANGHNMKALNLAVEDGSVDLVKFLIDNGAEVNSQDRQDDTPLHIATLWNKLEIIEILLQNNADVSIKNKEGKIPIEFINNHNNRDEIEAIYKKYENKS